MGNILISIAAKIAEYPVTPILHQFEYLIDFNKNISNLNQQTLQLEIIELQINRRVEQAIRNGEIMEPIVQSWLAIIEDESKINKNCYHGFCPNFIYRYCVSRKSTKNLKLITSLQEKAKKFGRASYPSTLPGIEYSLSKDIVPFESRNLTMEQILDELGKDETGVIILHGMRGIGKTTLVKQVCKRAKELRLFGDVVMAVVSRNPDLRNIQGQLADMLGLKFVEESEMGRAHRLYLRLKNEKILMVLDDVWGKLDLEAIGIPHHCKILITAENENIGISDGVGVKKIALKALLEEESWSLFKSVAGDIFDTLSFSVVAKEIVGKCMGLPLVLVTIGKRLRDKEIEEWKYVNRQIEGLEAKGPNLDDLLKDYV